MGDELKRVRMREKKMDQSTNNCITVFMVPKYKVQEIKEVNKEKIEKWSVKCCRKEQSKNKYIK